MKSAQSLTRLACAVTICACCPSLLLAQGYRELAPFAVVRFVPEVKIDGQWYVLRSIDGVTVESIIESAKKRHGDRWERRFGEDLVQLMTEMGHAPGETVKLVVRDPQTGKEKTLDKVPMTNANREAIRKNRNELESRPVVSVKPEALRGALDAFQAALDERWSYRHANRADFNTAIAGLRKKIDAGISTDEFSLELQAILARGIDSHAGVSGFSRSRGNALPFLVAAEGERVVVFNSGCTEFLADGFPYLTRIDGKEISTWCEAAAKFVPKGSKQFVRNRSLGRLRDLDHMRGLMNVPLKGTVEVELTDREGKAHKSLTLPVERVGPISEAWPRGSSRLLAGNVGYLRLAAMDAAAVREITTWMPQFRDTAGLVVDVRDNGGGSREALLKLYSFLAAPDDAPRVFTAAAYRLHKQHRDSHLADRFMHRADAKEWSEAERSAVAAFAKTFQPAWELPKGQFSDWHYMVLSRRAGPDVYHYAKPVVVLMNAGCFSATDIFLAGLKGMKTVTLLGTPSGGGSALVQEVVLGATPLRVRIGSMASFQADGKLFDGNGVQPDVVVEAEPEYHIGGVDRQLAEAVKRIGAK